MIKIEDVSKSFTVRGDLFHPLARRRQVTALERVNLSLEKNQIYALLGPNGAGKTTLIKIICGLILADQGRCSVEGKIGYLPGGLEGFYPQLTGRQNLNFFGIFYNLTPRLIEERSKRYAALLEIDDLDKPFWHYSQGLRRRLALLRMLMLEYPIIIMDEPSRSLDPLSSEKLQGLIPDLARRFNKTILFATHDFKEAQTMADKIAIINKGKIAALQDKAALKPQELESLYKEIVKQA